MSTMIIGCFSRSGLKLPFRRLGVVGAEIVKTNHQYGHLSIVPSNHLPIHTSDHPLHWTHRLDDDLLDVG
jgi:hypothetical protein